MEERWVATSHRVGLAATAIRMGGAVGTDGCELVNFSLLDVILFFMTGG
jgi:hypothetical protein